MTPQQKLLIEVSRLRGEFIGTLEGFLFWDLPDELADKIKMKIIQLQHQQEEFDKQNKYGLQKNS